MPDRFAQRLVQDQANLNKRRSYLPNMKHRVLTDFNPGLLVPLDLWEIIPGDTVKSKHAIKIRMTNPPKVPTMDQLVADLYFFYIPFRIINDNWDDLITANNGTTWNALPDYTIPQMILDTDIMATLPESTIYNFAEGSVCDYLGLSPFSVFKGLDTCSFNYMPITAYISCWNHYFRFEPVQDEILTHTDGNDLTLTKAQIQGFADMSYYYSGGFDVYMQNARSLGELFGGLLPTNKKDGYFERALPQPQRGPEVALLGFNDITLNGYTALDDESYSGLRFGVDQSLSGDEFVGSSNGVISLQNHLVNESSKLAVLDFEKTVEGYPSWTINSINASGLSGITGNTINDLRKAFAVQATLDLDARYGSRINEWTIGHFGVNVPDSRIDFPELLGQSTIYLNMQQVVQSSASTVDSKQGNTGAWSETIHKGFDFIKSFCEFGYIIPMITVRVLNHSYGSMIEKAWLRKTRWDFYLPSLANISDQPIKVEQLAGEAPGNEYVFGYQEAWADYKFMPSKVSHLMRPQHAQNLAVWNYAESYVPEDFILNEQFIIEDFANIARTVYLTPSATSSMFICDCYFDCDFVRELPLHTLPGGLTHSW